MKDLKTSMPILDVSYKPPHQIKRLCRKIGDGQWECDKVILFPRLQRTIVHFDREYRCGDLLVGSLYSRHHGCDIPYNHPAFPLSSPIEYICSDDKKVFREFQESVTNPFIDQDLSPADFGAEYMQSGVNFKIVPREVEVTAPVFICPQSGLSWLPERGSKPSRRHWMFKISPLTRMGRHRINTLAGDKIMLNKRDKRTAFMSGAWAHFRLKEHGCIGAWDFSDPRKFLRGRDKASKKALRKSLSRHLRKITKVRPVTASERLFFQAILGAKELSKYAN